MHYWFTTKEEFEKGIEQGRFLEHAHVHSNIYGTSYQVSVTILVRIVHAAAKTGFFMHPLCCVLCMPPFPHASFMTTTTNALAGKQVQTHAQLVYCNTP